jgi:hypothetical protein
MWVVLISRNIYLYATGFPIRVVIAWAATRRCLAQYGSVRSVFISVGCRLILSSFYGQGLNCGLEDVRVLNAYLEKHQISSTTTSKLGEDDAELEQVLKTYAQEREVDLRAICELALNN